MNNLVLAPEPDQSNINLSQINRTFLFKPNTLETKFFIATKKEDGDFEPCFASHTCRSYMGEGLFHIKARPHFPRESVFNKPSYTPSYLFQPTFDYLSGYTYIGLEIGNKNKIEMFKSRFSDLNDIEKEFNIPLSTYTILTNKPHIIMVEGSSMWKDSCWKIQLYTYMLKSLLTDKNIPSEPHFMCLVKKYYKELFGNIHMAPEEEIFDNKTFGEYTFNRHTLIGFVSICSGSNMPMAEVLGIYCEPTADDDMEDEDF